MRIIFALVGWTALALIFFYMGALLWVEYRQMTKYVNHWQWVLLAVDIPELFIQTPKAVEQIFAHLSGAEIHTTVGDRYWVGKRQKFFSFETISLEGYIQFLIRTEIEFRDLVEAAIYAQYPEAEITEVEDYVDLIPSHYPDSAYDVMGVEFKLAAEDAYPIRTYPSFEYSLSKDQVFSDPMAAILENFSRLSQGAYLWLQLIVEPTSSGWKSKGIELVKKIVAGKGHGRSSFVSTLLGFPNVLARDLLNVWNWNFEPAEGGHGGGHEETPGKVSDLTPGMKATVESIELKISKIGFKSKLRVLYAAKKEVYHPNRCLNGVVGAMSQFHVQISNAIVPHSVTHAHYDRKHKKSYRKKGRFVRAFKKRKFKAIANPYILNIEELATVWHFPLPFVKTPLMSKAGAKRAEPPRGLPVETFESAPADIPFEVESAAPEDLPYG